MGIYELGHQDQVETGYDCKAEDIEMHGKNVHILRMHKNVFRYIVHRTTYRAATAGKAPKAWALPRFWVSIFPYKKQPVKKILG